MTLFEGGFRRDEVLAVLYESEVRLTPRAFIKTIQDRFNLSGATAGKLLKQLVENRDLCYQYHFGTTYIEQSFLKPVQVSPHFILSPVFSSQPVSLSGGVSIFLEQGIAFGTGQHPTTRLCLNAIDWCGFNRELFKTVRSEECADIGTGSGVLAIALCKSGFSHCNAYEIDPVSVHEAKKNVIHNGLENRVDIQDREMEDQTGRYGVICANLRFPTLKTLSGMISNSLVNGGIVILSGIRVWENPFLIDLFSHAGFDLIRQTDEKKWSCFVWRKTDSLSAH